MNDRSEGSKNFVSMKFGWLRGDVYDYVQQFLDQIYLNYIWLMKM